MSLYTDQHPQFTIFNPVTGSFGPNVDGTVEFTKVGTIGAGNQKPTYFQEPFILANQNPNPMTLDGEGRSTAPVLLDGTYNTVIRDLDSNQVDQVDNVKPIGGTASGSVTATTVANVTELAALDTTEITQAFVVAQTTAGDSGYGHFRYDSGATESDNGLSVIEPTVGGGRWLLQNNAFDSITVGDAAGTTDTFSITPSPAVSALNNKKLYLVRSLGPNTFSGGGETFTVGSSPSGSIRRHNTGFLAPGDTGPTGYIMILQLRSDNSAYVLLNPYMVTTPQYFPKSVDQAALGLLSVGTPEMILNSATNDILADMPANTMKGNPTGGVGGPQDLVASAARANMGWGVNNWFIPVGMISMWSGTLATIPTGFSICDGSNGTPDLRDRFILSVGTAENPGATGGVADATTTTTSATSGGSPSGTVDSHTLTIAEMPAHFHDIQNVGGGGSGSGYIDTSSNDAGFNPTESTGGDGGHTHGFTDTGALPAHTHESTNEFPLFFKLAFIMFTG